MKCIHCLLLLLCPYFSKQQGILKVGDQVPAALLHTIQTQQGNSLASLQQHNKWIVLDFMASTCASCIKLLPSFNALKQSHAADLEIVLVTSQPKEKLQSFLQKQTVLQFPLITGDTLLRQYFPHQTISHLVWINPAGMVKAITSGYYLTPASFNQAKSGALLYWPVKQDGKPYDNTKALLTYHPANLQEAFEEAPLYYTAVRAALPDVRLQTSMVKDTLLQTQRYSFINQSLPQMMAKMLGRPTMPAAYYVLNTTKPGRLFHQLDTLLKDDWELPNLHCIEMQLPLTVSRAAVLQQFNHTLQQYFNLQVRLDTVSRKVWQVSGAPGQNTKSTEGYTLQSLGSIITALNKMPGAQPVVAAAATSIQQKIAMPLPGSVAAADVLQLLQQHGYQVQAITQPLESIIISDY